MVFDVGEVSASDLYAGAVYLGDGSLTNEPIHAILGTQNMKGIRSRNNVDGKTVFIALHSTGDVVEWPDSLDSRTGIATYFGDNRKVGKGLLEPDGNRLLERIFALDLGTEEGRSKFPPIFLFTDAGDHPKRSVRFDGLAVPGNASPEHEWCVAKCFKSSDRKFWNFEVKLTLLAEPVISKAWITDLLLGDRLSVHCPHWFRHWQQTGKRIAMAFH